MPKPTKQRLAAAKLRNDIAEQRVRAKRLALQRQLLGKIEKAGKAPAYTRSDRYDSSARTRLRPGARSTGGSADKHLSASVRSSLRRDCQDLERNSTAARVVIRRAQQLIVGDGPIVTAATPDKEWNKTADRLWNAYFDATDPDLVGYVDLARQRSGPEILAGIVSAWCTDGDQLVLRTKQGSLQVVESERVVSPKGPFAGAEMLANGGRIVDGVELDSAGAPVRFHVGEWDAAGFLKYDNTTPVNAANAVLITNPIGVRVGMTRGEPALQCVLDRIERLDTYELTVAVAAEIATKFAAIVQCANPAETQALWEAGTPDQPTRTNSDSPQEIEIEGGQIQFMNTGGAVTQLKPEFPTTNFKDYVCWHLQMIGAEIGLPLVATIYDASQLSWSNIKALLSLSMRSIEPSQARLARLVRWVRAWKLREWINEGLLTDRDDYAACDIAFPRAPVVDFKSEVEGYLEAINGRLMTRDQACQALGTGTFESVSDTAELEEKSLADKGIPAVNMPGAGGGGGGAAAKSEEAVP